jgi:hypothetical protein
VTALSAMAESASWKVATISSEAGLWTMCWICKVEGGGEIYWWLPCKWVAEGDGRYWGLTRLLKWQILMLWAGDIFGNLV